MLTNNIIKVIASSNYLEPFLWWYRQMAINMHFLAPSGNVTKKKKEMIRAIVFFLPTLFLGGLSYLLPNMAKKINKRDRERSFEYEVTIVAIVKNESLYIEEWIAYHHLIGVDRFVIYDNDSEDDLHGVLKKYIDAGLVEYVKYPGFNKQASAYSNALAKYKERTRFWGCLDIDEFIVLHEDTDLSSYLLKFFKVLPNAGGVAIQWYNYGSSGHKIKPKGLVIENFLYRAPVGFRPLVKTFGNPRLMKCFVNAHTPIYKLNVYTLNEDGEKVLGKKMGPNVSHHIHVNHYFTKSEEECRMKFSRGQAAWVPKYKWTFFAYTDRNNIFDCVLLEYVPKVEAIMKNTL